MSNLIVVITVIFLFLSGVTIHSYYCFLYAKKKYKITATIDFLLRRLTHAAYEHKALVKILINKLSHTSEYFTCFQDYKLDMLIRKNPYAPSSFFIYLLQKPVTVNEITKDMLTKVDFISLLFEEQNSSIHLFQKDFSFKFSKDVNGKYEIKFTDYTAFLWKSFKVNDPKQLHRWCVDILFITASKINEIIK